MGIWFHVKPPNNLPYMKLIANTNVNYIDLYEEVEVTAKKKNDKMENVIFYFKRFF